MQINTPAGILYVFQGRFMQQNAEDVSLDVGFICPFGGYTLQVLSARLKLSSVFRIGTGGSFRLLSPQWLYNL